MKKICNPEQLKYVREAQSEFGKLLLVKFEKLTFTLLCDRALDIYDLSYAGDNLAFLSANGMNKFGLETPFVTRFEGGFLYSCGLDNIGNPTENACLHGTMHLFPVTNIAWKIDVNQIEISAKINITALFGEKLQIERKYIVSAQKIELSDKIVNIGHTDAKIVQLYHFNIGYPMLSADTKINISQSEIIARTEHSAKHLKDIYSFKEPIDDNEECVYIHKLQTKNAVATVKNEKLNREISFEFETKNLPYLMLWKSEKSGDYALGIEPATTHLDEKNFKIIKKGENLVHNISIKFA